MGSGASNIAISPPAARAPTIPAAVAGTLIGSVVLLGSNALLPSPLPVGTGTGDGTGTGPSTPAFTPEPLDKIPRVVSAPNPKYCRTLTGFFLIQSKTGLQSIPPGLGLGGLEFLMFLSLSGPKPPPLRKSLANNLANFISSPIGPNNLPITKRPVNIFQFLPIQFKIPVIFSLFSGFFNQSNALFAINPVRTILKKSNNLSNIPFAGAMTLSKAPNNPFLILLVPSTAFSSSPNLLLDSAALIFVIASFSSAILFAKSNASCF